MTFCFASRTGTSSTRPCWLGARSLRRWKCSSWARQARLQMSPCSHPAIQRTKVCSRWEIQALCCKKLLNCLCYVVFTHPVVKKRCLLRIIIMLQTTAFIEIIIYNASRQLVRPSFRDADQNILFRLSNVIPALYIVLFYKYLLPISTLTNSDFQFSVFSLWAVI